MARFWFLGIWLAGWAATGSRVLAAELAETDFPAAGNHETLLRVQEPGRYRLRVDGGRGTAISLVDRMAGPFVRAGEAGVENGRLEVLLEPGEYKVRLFCPDRSSGRITLAVLPFSEADPANFPLLRQQRIVETQLEDLRQRSYRIVLGEPGTFRLEVMGRGLRECALWAAGGWLVDLSPTVTEYEAESGRPMTHIEFHQGLAAGQYRLTCYGGVPRAWADEDGMKPLYLRLGQREAGVSGLHPVTISPFGREAFLLPASANFFELKREQKKNTRMVVRRFQENGARFGDGRSATIDKKSPAPTCGLLVNGSGKKQWVVIEAEPGANLLFQHFTRLEQARFYGKKRYWVSSQHNFSAADTLEMTGLIVKSEGEQPLDTQMPALSRGEPLARQTNLSQPMQMFFQVVEEGLYSIALFPDSDARAEFQIEPFLVRKPRGYKASAFQPAGSSWPLVAGYYVLNLKPTQKGILQFLISHSGDGLAAETFPPALSGAGVRRGLLWPDIMPGGGPRNPRDIILNRGANLISSLVVRPLPLDLDKPLTFSLLEAETVPIEFQVRRPAELIVEGAGWEIRTSDGVSWDGSPLQPGIYRLSFKNTQGKTAWFCLHTELAPVAVAARNDLTDFSEALPVLRVGQPYFTDLDRQVWQSLLLNVSEPGLYRLETTGRMATALHVRTRAITGLYAENRNGIGRNALVQNYFKPGSYLANVMAMGNSEGRTSIQLRRTLLEEGPWLRLGAIQKRTLAPDSAVHYPFKIKRAGRYRIQTMGLGKTFAYRLEDGDGWPLVEPGAAGAAEFQLGPGTYHYYSLPDAVEGRRLSSIERLAPAREFEGKDPLVIGFNETVGRIWRQGNPDIYSLMVPAPVEATLSLSAGMSAAVQKDGAPLFDVMAAKGWKGTLEPGDYRFLLRRTERDDRFPYTFKVETGELIAGLRQRVETFPARLPVSVGGEGLVDIISLGPTDIEARLTDASGQRLLAHNDDGENDWNIHISTSLEPGRYLLELTRVGQDYGPAELRLVARQMKPLPEHGVPFQLRVDAGTEVASIPFRMDSAGLLLVETGGAGEPRLSLWREGGLIAEGRGRLAVPLHAQTTYRLLAWQGNSGGAPFSLHAARAESSLVVLDSADPLLKPRVYYQLESALGTAYQLSDQNVEAWFSSDWERPLVALGSNLVNLHRGVGWLHLQNSRSRLAPYRLAPGDKVSLELIDPELSFFLDPSGTNPILVEVETVVAALGMSLLGENQQVPAPLDWRTMAREKNLLFASFAGGGKPRLKIWRTDASRKPERLSIGVFGFEPASELPEEISDQPRTLEPGTYHSWEVVPPLRGVEALLSGGLLAMTLENGRITALGPALSAHGKESFSLEKGTLLVLNHGTRAAPYRLRALFDEPAGGMSVRDFRGEYEAVFERRGHMRFALPVLAAGKRLFMRGDGVTARHLSARGLVHELPSGSGLEIDGGVLEVQHGPGWVKLWIADSPSMDLTFMGDPPPNRPRDLGAGEGMLGNEPSIWRFRLDAPYYVVIDADGPGASALLSGDQILAVAAGRDRAARRLNHFLPAGDYGVWTRPLAGRGQYGAIRLLKVRPVLLQESETGPAFLIGSGESHVYQFRVTEPGKVGLGVVTESDQLEVSLYDESFQQLASGPLVYGELPPGAYVLVIRAGEDSVMYRPKLLGLDGPGSELPEEVRREYLKVEASQSQ